HRPALLRLGGRGDARVHRDRLLGRPLLRLRGLPGADAGGARLVGGDTDRGLLAGAADLRPRGALRRPLARPPWAAGADDGRLAPGCPPRARLVPSPGRGGLLPRLGGDRAGDGDHALRAGVRHGGDLVRAGAGQGPAARDARRRLRQHHLPAALGLAGWGARLAAGARSPRRGPRRRHGPPPRPPAPAAAGGSRPAARRHPGGRHRVRHGGGARRGNAAPGAARPRLPVADGGVLPRHVLAGGGGGPPDPLPGRARRRARLRRLCRRPDRRRPGRRPGACNRPRRPGLAGGPDGRGLRLAGGRPGRPDGVAEPGRGAGRRPPPGCGAGRLDADAGRADRRVLRPRPLRRDRRAAGAVPDRRPRPGPGRRGPRLRGRWRLRPGPLGVGGRLDAGGRRHARRPPSASGDSLGV
ncbi:MAG: Uncharacterized MFS-type transporter, partial [uncultured Thermomicrobiales bacterium]